jgi:hypothetical protein
VPSNDPSFVPRSHLAAGEDWFAPDGASSVQVLEPGERPNAEAVEIATWLGGDSSLEGQVIAAVDAPLNEKLRGQLAEAKRVGHAVMLLLDQVPDSARRQRAMFLASWATVKIVVDRIIALYPGVVDCVWLRESDGGSRNLTASSIG